MMARLPFAQYRRPVAFYTRPNCPLCDEARDLLFEFEREVPLEVTEVNILSDPVIYESYKHQIPVITVEGGHSVWGRIEKESLSRLLVGR